MYEQNKFSIFWAINPKDLSPRNTASRKRTVFTLRNFSGHTHRVCPEQHFKSEIERFTPCNFLRTLREGARLDSKIFFTPLYKWTFLSRVLSDTLCPLEYLLQSAFFKKYTN